MSCFIFGVTNLPECPVEKNNREKFPRGLSQPETGFRFSVDSLLLSCFISPAQENKVVDIGCGCGVIGLGLILANPQKDIHVTGLDNCPDMINHSHKNTALLKLSTRFTPLEMDVCKVNSKSFQAETFDLAVANPPYRIPESGRAPQDISRFKASFCDHAELDLFFKAAAFLLKNKGKCGIIFRAERLDNLLEKMKRHSLTPKRILPVYGKLAKPAGLVMVEGVKNARPGLKMMSPLILYDKYNQFTSQALEFCSFLGCNPSRGLAVPRGSAFS